MPQQQEQDDSPRWVAARAGEVFYLHPSECGVCGGTARYTSSGQCVDCTKLRSKERTYQLRNTLRTNKRGA